MATLLLARPDKTTRGKDLRRTLLHLLHGLQAIENALEAFMLSYSSHGDLLVIAGHHDVLGNFDAHVGDTACHMRAQMIWEVYEYHRPAENRSWISLALVALARIKADTISLLIALHNKRGYMRALGFGTIVTYGQIFDRVGWSAFLDMLGKEANATVLYPVLDGAMSEACCSDDAATPMPVNPIDSEQLPQLDREYEEEERMSRSSSSDSLSSESFPISSSSSSSSAAFRTYSSSQTSISSFSDCCSTFRTPPTIVPSHSYRSITMDCEWDITNHLQVIRLLTLCRLLTVGKTAKVFPGFPNAVIRARTDPEFVYEQTGNELETYYSSLGQEVKWNILVSADDRVKKTFLVREEESVQVWLSNLTADWTFNLAKEVGLSKSMQSFLKSSIEVSPRQIVCVAAHASIIPIRADWLGKGTPILMLIRRFCSKGYHSSFYRVTPDISAWPPNDPIENIRAVDVGSETWFSIQSVTLEQTRTASWSTSPHFILISNSIDGSCGDFYDRVAGDGYGHEGAPWPHNCDDCDEHREHVPKVLESNFSRIAMGFFGQHEQYPFDLTFLANENGDVDGYDHVAGKMLAHGFEEKVMEHYWRACKEVEESGTGDSPWLYTFEHAFAELPCVVARHAEEIIKRNIKPVPIGYRWW